MSSVTDANLFVKPGRVACGRCRGTGRYFDRLNPSNADCPDCNGHGLVVRHDEPEPGPGSGEYVLASGLDVVETGRDLVPLVEQACRDWSLTNEHLACWLLPAEGSQDGPKLVALLRPGQGGKTQATYLS